MALGPESRHGWRPRPGDAFRPASVVPPQAGVGGATDRDGDLPVHRHRGLPRLLQELGNRYAAVRDDHAAILRHAIQEGGGVEVNTEGDSFFAACGPAGAVRAAFTAQRA